MAALDAVDQSASRGLGRLFWKLLLALWISTLLTIGGVLLYFQLTGKKPPPPDDEIAMIGFVPVVPFVSGAFAMLVTSMSMAWYLSRPLHHLRWALHRVTEGHLDTRVKARMGRRRDEIVDLASDFDRMASQLQLLTEAQNVLLHDISHELRSPLTRLQVAIGLLRQNPAQLDSMLERIERESQRLDALIEELLTLHRLEAGMMGIATERVDVIELLQAIVEDAQFEAHGVGKEVGSQISGHFVASVNGELVCRAFENVIRNAIKFSGEGTSVQVVAHVSISDDQLICTVQDRGPGVPPQMLDAIFQPFMRVPGSEPVHGSGLGLAIAKRALSLHGGDITAQPREGGGLTVTMVLPRQGPSSA